ncbi:MAG: hypothetical protein D6798_14725 [Deltaproteobacteria bacterium]|nr:MAG: hypothetical protein D6798_14725 [Deltaproteobacteria bacterium]
MIVTRLVSATAALLACTTALCSCAPVPGIAPHGGGDSGARDSGSSDSGSSDGGSSDGGATTFDYPLDDVLRLNHAQVLGTHNSYHVAHDPPLVVEWGYTHAPLDVQLEEQGVRQFELDVRYEPETGRFEVYHVPVIDEETTCLAFVDCLQTIAAWSAAHPAHLPIFVLVEPKDEGAPEPFVDHVDDFEAELRSVFPDDRHLTPDALQGEADTLRDAVLDAGGWPVLGQIRGTVIFGLLDGGEARDAYTRNGTSLAGRAMFADMDDPAHPLASFFLVDDPVAGAASIASAVDQGFLVRTRADAGSEEPLAGDDSRLQAALASGAHFLSTDYPAPVEGVDYVAAIPGGTPARCNPRTAPAACTSTALEDPAFMNPAPHRALRPGATRSPAGG